MASPEHLWLVDFGEPIPGEPARHRGAVFVLPPTTFAASFLRLGAVDRTSMDRIDDIVGMLLRR